VIRLGRRVIALTPRRECSVQVEVIRTRYAIIMVRRDTSLKITSSPSRENPPLKTSKYKNQVMRSKTTIRARIRPMRRKRTIIRRPSSTQKRKGKI
jgi:hypothetical protein